MEISKVNLSGLSNEQLLIVASQLSAATASASPRLESEQKAREQTWRNLERYYSLLLELKDKGTSLLSAGMDLS